MPETIAPTSRRARADALRPAMRRCRPPPFCGGRAVSGLRGADPDGHHVGRVVRGPRPREEREEVAPDVVQTLVVTQEQTASDGCVLHVERPAELLIGP